MEFLVWSGFQLALRVCLVVMCTAMWFLGFTMQGDMELLE